MVVPHRSINRDNNIHIRSVFDTMVTHCRVKIDHVLMCWGKPIMWWPTNLVIGFPYMLHPGWIAPCSIKIDADHITSTIHQIRMMASFEHKTHCVNEFQFRFQFRSRSKSNRSVQNDKASLLATRSIWNKVGLDLIVFLNDDHADIQFFKSLVFLLCVSLTVDLSGV
jgi:hypothetical protein